MTNTVVPQNIEQHYVLHIDNEGTYVKDGSECNTEDCNIDFTSDVEQAKSFGTISDAVQFVRDMPREGRTQLIDWSIQRINTTTTFIAKVN